MKMSRKLILLGIKILGYSVTFLIPFIMLYRQLFHNSIQKAQINFGIAFIALALLAIWMTWLKKIFYRKLDAIATVEEMGSKTATNFIMVRILKSLEYTLPFIVLTFFMRGLKYIELPPEKLFYDILLAFLGGFLILILHDGLKNHFINLTLVEESLELENKVETLKKKQAVKLSRK